ncbi:MAG: EAL domain-containing protein [Microthrixaceae bacterium]
MAGAEDPPWQPQLFRFLLRSRGPWFVAMSTAILLTVDTGSELPWLLGLLAATGAVNLATYRRVVSRTRVPEWVGLVDTVSPMLLTVWIPELVFAALMVSVMAAALATHVRPADGGGGGRHRGRLGLGDRRGPSDAVVEGGDRVLPHHGHPGGDRPRRPHAREMRVAERLRELVVRDDLTGLFNRASLLTRLGEHIDAAEGGRSVGLIYLDLDRFKEVNDGLGHHHGDLLLVEIARRLSATLPDATVARMGGDEFAAILDVADVAEVVMWAELVQRALAEPITLDSLPLTVGASIGIAIAPEHSEDPATLIKQADTAMYRSKVDRGTVTVYGPGDEREPVARLQVLSGLREAVAEDRLCLAYQPVVDLHTGTIRAYEALVRWDHPQLGLLAPAAFLESARMTGAISDITRWVLGRAIGDAARWRRGGHDIGVSVNLSTVDLRREWLGADLDRELDRHGLDPSALTLELTEAVASRHLEAVASLLRGLADRGVRISLDDFGARHTSLSSLREFPLTQVKLDPSLVSRLDEPMSRELVTSLVGLGERAGLDIVAEGLHDATVVRQVVDLGCGLGQGHHLGMPVPWSALVYSCGGRVVEATGRAALADPVAPPDGV